MYLSSSLFHTTTDELLFLCLQMERRERLRKHLAEREAAGEGAPDGAPLIGQVGQEESAIMLYDIISCDHVVGGIGYVPVHDLRCCC
jgi:hypothetical protein